jgi:hypothetical protein
VLLKDTSFLRSLSFCQNRPNYFRSGQFFYVICWEILRRVGNTALPRGYAEAEEYQAPGEQDISIPALESLHFRI